MPHCIAWVGSLPDIVKVQNGRARFYVRGIHPTQDEMRLLDGDVAVAALHEQVLHANGCGTVVGAVRFRIDRVWHHLQSTTPEDMAQYCAWHSLIDAELQGCLYRCVIKDAVCFQVPEFLASTLYLYDIYIYRYE